ncbi:hypothetical protein NC651_002376 [Populus alba x Populus x berolinensis]|nr:hypothetical protein NC651_002376 [Populus alba x Populus x berolinensis]
MALIMMRSVATTRRGFFKLKRSSNGIRAFSSLLTSPPSKAVFYERHGPPDAVTRVMEMEGVEVKEKDVCVKMMAAPINPSDINRIEGVYPVRPPLPAVGGYEGVGEVLSVGSAVKHLSPGDWVIPSPPSSGTWQTYIVKEESVWHKISKDSPIEYAATITVNPLTALRMLQDFVTLNSGDCIVQNGATSIVGQCIIQLARLRGIHSINIIRDRCCFSSKPFSDTFLVYLSIVCLFLCTFSMPLLHLCSVSVVAFAWCNRFASSSSRVMSRFDKMNSRLACFFCH